MFRELTQRTRALCTLSPKVGKFLRQILIISLIFEAVKLLPPYIFKLIIDEVVVYDPAVGLTFELILPLIIAYAGGLFFMTLIEIVYTRFGEYLIRNAEIDITSKVLAKLLKLDMNYHEQNNTGESINKIVRGASKMADLFYHFMWALFPISIQAFFTLIILFIFGWQVGVVFLVFVPIFMYFLMRGTRMTQASREEYHKQYDLFAGAIGQSVMNIRTVKDFDNEDLEMKKAESKLSAYMKALLIRVRLGLKNRVFEDGLVSLGRVLTLIFAVLLMVNGQITAGSLVFIVTLTEKAFINIARLYRVYYRVQDIEPAIDRFKSIFDEEIKTKDNPRSRKKVRRGRIELRDVSFKYKGSRKRAIKGISFTIEPKQTVALVGRSGCGKSTIVKLLLRHFDVTSGDLLIDGTPVKDYSFRNLRRSIAVVSQDVELFNASIRDNIAYGNPKASEKEIIKAAKMAYAHDFIQGIEGGYDALVGERGVKLSGGQKQRIAIARALLTKPKILIFDEATSALDAESERYIHESIFNLIGKLTLVLIAHRFSTIEHADKIILLESGEVKEVGTHEQLLKKKGIFARLRKLQELGDVD